MPHRLLDRIDAPSDLGRLSYNELAQVAQEARDTIISVITERGGHLASNLGVVELTLALHRVFDSPRDSIVWDTTNQTYTHKLVTGRRDESRPSAWKAACPGSGNQAKAPTTRSVPATPAPDFQSLSASRKAKRSAGRTRGPSRWLGTGR